jgi:hypothetical protein
VTPITRIRWPASYRIIPTRFPATPLFVDVAPEADWDDLHALSELTSPRVVQTQGRFGLYSKEDLGPAGGAQDGADEGEEQRDLIVAAFTYVNPEGSRFSDGSYGVYYAARKLETAIDETVHHRRRFWLQSRLPALHFPMKVLEARIDGELHDIRVKSPDRKILDPDSYAVSKAFALKLKAEHKSLGIAYPSVRHAGGECVAAFVPRVVSRCKRTQLLDYIWDGAGEVTVVKMDVVKVLKGAGRMR